MSDSSSNTSTLSSLKVPLYAVVFALSGASINLLQQQLFYAGAGNAQSLVLIVPTFVGCLLGGLASRAARAELSGHNTSTKSLSSSSSLVLRMKQLAWMSIFDVASQVLRSTSQNLCGSGMFTVIYAILPAFNGVLSYIFMGRILNKRQWAAIGVVVCGLALSAESEEDSLKGDKKWSVALGIGLGLMGTLSSSASYLSAEFVFKSPDAPKEGTTVTAVNGINDLLIAMPWILFYSVPNRQSLIYDPVAAAGVSPLWIWTYWLALVVSNAAHLNSCYALLQITESVTLTMLQGLRAVMVFAVSGLLFCSPNSPEQCLTWQKILCMVQVMFGVGLYAKSTAGLSKHIGNTTGKELKEKDSNIYDNHREDEESANSLPPARKGSKRRSVLSPTSNGSVSVATSIGSAASGRS